MDQQLSNKNRDVRRLSAYQERPSAAAEPQSFDSLLKEIEERRNRPSYKWYGVGICAFLILAGGFFFLWRSASLRVVLTPKKVTIAPAGQTIALPFEAISLRVPLEAQNIPFTVKKVEERARGTVVVYNAYSVKPHTFVARTRFESPEGTIYRIEKPLSIPGARQEGDTLVPGSTEVEIIAENPGEGSNKEFADFTVPGLKGSALFEKFYARSKGPISGGRTGEERVIDRKALEEGTFADQEGALVDKLRAQIPEGFLLPESAWTVAYREGSSQWEAEITGWMVKRNDLGAKLAALFFESDQAKRVVLLNTSRLSIANISSASNGAIKEDSLRVSVEGEAMYAEYIAKEEMPSALANLQSSEEIDAFLKNLGSVESATLIFSPAFLKHIPSDPDHITIDTMQ